MQRNIDQFAGSGRGIRTQQKSSEPIRVGLFTVATEAVEAAHIIAVDGQSPRRSALQYARLAQRLVALARNVHALGDAALVVAGRSQPQNTKKAARRRE